MNNNNFQYENFETERLEPIFDLINPYSEMSKIQRYFLNGMIRYVKPKKILEIGVSSGGGSAIILNAISDIDGAKLFSVDYSEKAYRHPNKPSGFLVEESFSHLKNKWEIFRGADVSKFIESIGDNIDMLVLDTAHIHPMETLNFLCVLPFMKQSFSWTILHDITLFAGAKSRSSLACRYLYGHVATEERITPEEKGEYNFSNIGAFKVSPDTLKYSDNLFESLLIPWGMSIQEKDINTMNNVIKKYYSVEQVKFFQNVLAFQKYITNNPPTFKSEIKSVIREYYPHLYSFLRKLKSFFKRH